MKYKLIKLFKVFGAILAIYVLYLILGATIPFIQFPEVNDDFKNSFSTDKFYNDTIGVDRAAIIEDSDDALDVRLHMLNEAKESIIISSFSVKNDRSCKEIFSTILNAANRGVKVQIILDGITSAHDMKNDTMYYVLGTHPNVEIRFYNTINLLKPWNLNGRLHDKYIIIDDKLLLLGGRNISNYFLGEYNTKVLSYDRDILVYNTTWNSKDTSSSVISEVKDYFNTIWNSDYNKTVFNTVPRYKKKDMNRAEIELEDYYHSLITERPELFQSLDYALITVPTNKISLISNPINLTSKEPYVYYQLTQLMMQAKEKVILQTPYAVLNDTMYSDLQQISNSVPNVTMFLNSTAGGDNFMASADYTWNKDKVIATGVTLYEFQGDHSMHNKSLLIDDNISVIGSYNLDMRSTYLDTEVMLVVNGTEFNQLLSEKMSDMLDKSLPVMSDGSYGTNGDVVALEPTTWQKISLGICSAVFQLFRFLL